MGRHHLRVRRHLGWCSARRVLWGHLRGAVGPTDPCEGGETRRPGRVRAGAHSVGALTRLKPNTGRSKGARVLAFSCIHPPGACAGGVGAVCIGRAFDGHCEGRHSPERVFAASVR